LRRTAKGAQSLEAGLANWSGRMAS
jgi:hypothetical protein